MSLFKHFNHVLSLYGVRLAPKSRITKLFNYVTLLNNVTAVIALFIATVREATVRPHFILIEYFYTMTAMAQLVFVFKCKHNDIIELQHKLQLLLNKQQLNRLQRISGYIIAAKLVAMAIGLSLAWDLLVHNDPVVLQSFALISDKQLRGVAQSWLMAMSSLHANCIHFQAMMYGFTFYAISQIKINFLKQIRSKVNVNNARLLWCDVIELELQFERDFNIIPLMTFTLAFIQTTIYIDMFVKGWLVSEIAIVFVICYWLMSLLHSASIVFLIDSGNNNVHKHFNVFLKQNINSHDTNVKELISYIQQNINFNLTAFGMFQLDKSVILAFASSLVTFTILLVQTK